MAITPKFTRGPWGYVQCKPKMQGFFIIQADNFNRVGIEVEGSSEEATANVHLVASAPDLYWALRVMVQEWCEAIGSEQENSTPGNVLEKARAALASAEGK